jgi:hypothetical protein
MNVKNLYWGLCIPGIILPYSSFVPWFLNHGFDIPLFVSELFSTPIGSFFGWDVIVSTLVLFVFVYAEKKRLKIKLWWLSIAATLCVGVSLGLPLFLAMREMAMERRRGRAEAIAIPSV